MQLVVLAAGLFVLTLGAHGCRRWERDHHARLVSMGWDEIAERNRSRTSRHRAIATAGRHLGRAREALLLTAVCFAMAALFVIAGS